MKDIKALREERGMTIYRLSKLSGISQPTIKALESKKYSPTIHTLNTLAESLGVTLEHLLKD